MSKAISVILSHAQARLAS